MQTTQIAVDGFFASQGSSPAPVYMKLAESLEQAIENGTFKAGDRMPSTRELSKMTGVSRPTIIAAYEVLLSRNLVQMRTGCGVFVAPPLQPNEGERNRLLERDVSTLLSRRCLSPFIAPDSSQKEWCLFNPPSHAVPTAKWRRIAARHTEHDDPTRRDFEYETYGLPKLKRTLSAYVRRARGISCLDGDVVIFSSAGQAIHSVLHLLLDEGDTVVCDSASSPAQNELLRSVGANIVPAPHDKDGLSVDSLQNMGVKAKMIVISPMHQGTASVTLSLQRRVELVQWAAANQTFILELDEEHFFSPASPAIRAASGLDDSGLCIYLSSFSGVLSSLSKLSFLVLPPDLVEHMRSIKRSFNPCDLSISEQHALSDFITEGYMDIAVRQARNDFLERLRAFIMVATRMLPDLILSRTAHQFFLLTEWDGAVSPVHFKQIADETLMRFIPARAVFPSASANQFVVPFTHYSPQEMSQALNDIALTIKVEMNSEMNNDISFKPRQSASVNVVESVFENVVDLSAGNLEINCSSQI